MLKSGSPYNEDIFETVKQRQSERHKKRIMAEAKKLGLQIIEPTKAETA